MDNLSKAPKTTVAMFLTRHIDNLVQGREKSQKEIANEIGYEKANIITMFKQGLTSLPIYKVEAMAKAIHVDSLYLLRLVMSEYMPESYETVVKLLSDKSFISDTEVDLIKRMREHSAYLDYDKFTPHQKEAFYNFLITL